MDISVEMCLGGRDLTEPRLSPDGSAVAFVSRWGLNTAIVSVPSDGGPERIVSTEPQPSPGRGLSGGCFDWLPDGTAIVYAARDSQLWLQPMPGGPPRRLSVVDGDRWVAAPAVSNDGRSVAAVVDQAEIWEWQIDGSGATRLDDDSADFVIDPSPMPTGFDVGWIWEAWNVPDMPWDHSRAQFVIDADGDAGHGEFVPTASVQQLRHHPDGRGLCVRDDTGWLNVWIGDEPLVDEPVEHAGPAWGMGQRSYAVSPDGAHIAFTRNEQGFGRLCVADVESRDVTEVARGVHGQLSWAGDRLAAIRTGARTPTQVVSYHVPTWERTVLAVGPVTGWESGDLPEPELVTVDHDDTTLHARRYVAGEGRTLCWVHGGPTDQWQVEFMPRVAYWWSQGWDVLVPDPRGTTGHGRDYQQALHGGWGRLDVDDTAAIVRAGHDAGHSTPERTAMMGGSSGGLTALGVLADHPELAAGGVVLYPVADLAVLADESHRFEAHYTVTLVGPLDDADLYARRSPISYASRITRPLLVMHGDSDPVVPLASTIDLAGRIRRAGGDVELVVMEGEGHGFRDPANKRLEYEHTAAFLASLLGGRDG